MFSKVVSTNTHFGSNLKLALVFEKGYPRRLINKRCLDKTPGQATKRRKRWRRRRRKSSFTSLTSFESISTQRTRDRIRRRNHLKRGAIGPRKAVVISGEPVSKWKSDDILGIYDLVGTDATGRPIYKVICVSRTTCFILCYSDDWQIH